MKKALFPGTFDPPTLGHLDIIKRSSEVCDQLYVGIAGNAEKTKEIFSLEERKEMLQAICKPFPHVKITTFSTLATAFAREHSIDFLLRGLRTFSDFEYELKMSFANRRLSGIDTIFLMADEKVAHISSTLIREIGRYQSRLHGFVPDEIEDLIFHKLSSIN